MVLFVEARQDDRNVRPRRRASRRIRAIRGPSGALAGRGMRVLTPGEDTPVMHRLLARLDIHTW